MKFDFLKVLPLEWLAKTAISAVEKIADAKIAGETLPVEGQKIVQTVHALGTIWGKDLVAATPTDIDDKALEAAMALCVDTAAEGGFQLLKF
jgi:hypothetical protein